MLKSVNVNIAWLTSFLKILVSLFLGEFILGADEFLEEFKRLGDDVTDTGKDTGKGKGKKDKGKKKEKNVKDEQVKEKVAEKLKRYGKLAFGKFVTPFVIIGNLFRKS